MTLIGLTGYAGAGKDAVATHLTERCGFTRVAFADALRSSLYALNPIIGPTRLQEHVDAVGWDAAKAHPEVRALLQRLGTEAGRNVLGTDIWVDAAMRYADLWEHCVISDCRFPNEAAAVIIRKGHLVRVVRPGVEAVNGHISEHALDAFPAAVTIHNDGTLGDLGVKVELAMEELGVL